MVGVILKGSREPPPHTLHTQQLFTTCTSCFLALTLILLVCCSSPLWSCTAVANEWSALRAIYTTWGSPAFLSSWSSSDPCDGSWESITCTGALMTGIHMQLGDGTPTTPVYNPLDPAVGNLTDLTSLSFGAMAIIGQLPSTLSKLTNLQTLAISGNGYSSFPSLTGTIPAQFSAMSALRYLGFSSNNLRGSLPPQLSTLTNLLELSLYWNSLTGSISPGLSALTALQDLEIYGNQLQGTLPPELSSMYSRGCRFSVASNSGGKNALCASSSIFPGLGLDCPMPSRECGWTSLVVLFHKLS